MATLSTDANGNQYLNDLNANTGADTFPCTSSDWSPFFAAKWGVDLNKWKVYNNNYHIRFPASGIETKSGQMTQEWYQAEILARVRWSKDKEAGTDEGVILFTGNSSSNTQKMFLSGTNRTSSNTEVTFAILNDYALAYCCFSDSTLTTLVSWSYLGWLNKPQKTGAIYPQGLVSINSFRNQYVRVTNVNTDYGFGGAITTLLSTADNSVTNPPFTCETGFTCPVTTPDYTSITLRDNASPNQPVGELYHYIFVPSSYASGTTVKDQTGQKYIVCGALGGKKVAMKIKATGYV